MTDKLLYEIGEEAEYAKYVLSHEAEGCVVTLEPTFPENYQIRASFLRIDEVIQEWYVELSERYNNAFSVRWDKTVSKWLPELKFFQFEIVKTTYAKLLSEKACVFKDKFYLTPYDFITKVKTRLMMRPWKLENPAINQRIVMRTCKDVFIEEIENNRDKIINEKKAAVNETIDEIVERVKNEVKEIYNLERFLKAQEYDYANALSEIKSGMKRSHWMWYIFPQLKELGRSSTAKYYGIENIEEAKQYITHPVLGARLREISEELLKLKTNDPYMVMGNIDGLKLCSSMTLFAEVEGYDSVFGRVIDKYYNKNKDMNTIRILNEGK